MKSNTVYESVEELDIPDQADSGILKDEEIFLTYKDKKEKKELKIRRIAYWNSNNSRLLVFITNNGSRTKVVEQQNFKHKFQLI